MPRRQRGGRKSKPKAIKQVATPDSDEKPFSPIARQVAAKIAQGGETYLRNSFERVLIDSHLLIEEPEFANLLFEASKTIKTTERYIKKYDLRLTEAEKKGKDHFQQVYDEMRIEIIDEIASPPFRKEVFRRLERLNARLITTYDARRIEIALLLGSVLRITDIPWGICGLIIAIYNRTIQQTVREYEEQEEILGDLADELLQGEDPAEVVARLEEPEKIAEITKKLDEKSEIRQRLERQLDKAVVVFENALFKGEIDLDVFTPEELSIFGKRLSEELSTQQAEITDANAKQIAEKYMEFARRCLLEIMTPERMQRLKSDLERRFQNWLRVKNKWALPLQAEIGWLDQIEVAENRFLMVAYMGSIRRFMNKRTSKDLSEKPHSTKSRGLVNRARGLFR